MTLAVALLAGLLIGILLATLGAGGSVLAVPALLALGLEPYAATTGSLVVVGAAAGVGAIAARGRGDLALDRGLLFAAAALAGAVVGATVSGLVPQSVLVLAFGALLVVVAALMLLMPQPEGSGHGTILTLRPWRCDCPRVVAVTVSATLVGLLTGFLGVGGGFLVVPALVLALGLDLRTSVGTSLVVIALTSTAALTTRLVQGAAVDWAPVLVLTGAALAATVIASRFAPRVPSRALRLGFPAVLLATAGITMAQGVPALA